jgi:hypothetical protein
LDWALCKGAQFRSDVYVVPQVGLGDVSSFYFSDFSVGETVVT